MRRPKGTGEGATCGTTKEAEETGTGMETTKEGSGEKEGADREDRAGRKEEARRRRGDRSWEMKSESSRVREEETGENGEKKDNYFVRVLWHPGRTGVGQDRDEEHCRPLLLQQTDDFEGHEYITLKEFQTLTATTLHEWSMWSSV